MAETRTALVTGGGAGIGAATVLRFAEEGAHVISVDKDVENGKRIMAQVHERGGSGLFLEADLADSPSIERVANTVQETVAGHRVIKAFGLEKILLPKFCRLAESSAHSAVRVNFLSALAGRSGGVSVTFLILVIIGAGAYLSIRGHVTGGAMVAFVALLLNVGDGAHDDLCAH